MSVIDYTVSFQVLSQQLEQIHSVLELIAFVLLFEFVMKRFDILKFIQKGKSK